MIISIITRYCAKAKPQLSKLKSYKKAGRRDARAGIKSLSLWIFLALKRVIGNWVSDRDSS